MATFRVRLKGLFKTKAKGKMYYYAWRGGPRMETEFGTPEFIAEFNALRAPKPANDRGKFGTWITLYRACKVKRGAAAKHAYCDLSEKTKENWDRFLDSADKHFGRVSIRQFDRPTIRVDIRKWRDEWAQSPRAADMAKQALSRVCSFMVAEGVLGSNPCEGIENLYENDRADIIWRDADLAKLCETASAEIGYAAKLGALTGLRQGDLLRLPWSRVGEFEIEMPTSKSRKKRAARIPITADLRACLATIPKRGTTVLTNSYGRPWKSGFRASWQTAMRRSGLNLDERDLHFHDLRGTAATKFYVAGLTSREIADILGWSPEHVEQLIERYVKRDELVQARIRKLEQSEIQNRKTDSKTGG